jgi:hypothetical protein
MIKIHDIEIFLLIKSFNLSQPKKNRIIIVFSFSFIFLEKHFLFILFQSYFTDRILNSILYKKHLYEQIDSSYKNDQNSRESTQVNITYHSSHSDAYYITSIHQHLLRKFISDWFLLELIIFTLYDHVFTGKWSDLQTTIKNYIEWSYNLNIFSIKLFSSNSLLHKVCGNTSRTKVIISRRYQLFLGNYFK